ncbi:serine hydrolase domain-containing protein [Streptomyces yaizuensis]|uniref:Serine hydrolase n=1 Tax=Streptomyces yaizuensis TaxID=2989713 RepID=A0ABQ5NXJ2_9ACTN|nr:serine hydrolase domain-containing protein [Streptomyces sp. YSPA8]GLF95087.1 serine hydrolase [Streptomyces sp. YSPA8]
MNTPVDTPVNPAVNPPVHKSRGKSRSRTAVTAALAIALAGGALTAPAAATASTDTGNTQNAESATAGEDRRATPLTRAQLARELERTLKEAGYVGIAVEVRHGDTRIHADAGEAALGTGRPTPRNAVFRAASVTKSFVATVVLQLVAEGRLSLDDTVETWLPGLVDGNGNDGRLITLRHLLQHTGGIYNWDHTEVTGDTAEDFERTRFDRFTPEESIAHAMRHRPDFPPAAPGDPAPPWNYSNPGYLIAGMVIEKATGRPWAEEVERRIIRPLGLRDTRAPGDDPFLRAPHARTYHTFRGSDRWTDTTVRNMTSADAAGALISTRRDLDRFYTALLRGRLLPAAQLAEMRRTVPVGGVIGEVMPGLGYGLGLMKQPLSCGGDRWGHGGDLDGATVRTGVTSDGSRSVVIAASGKTAGFDQLARAERAVQRLVERALCGNVNGGGGERVRDGG